MRRDAFVQQCPFCAETIRVGAMKCKHCGEFLTGAAAAPPPAAAPSPDGAPPPQAQLGQQPPTVQIFLIDGSAFGLQGNMLVRGGAALDADFAGRLPEGTLRAIRSNDPNLIEGPGVRALDEPTATKLLPGGMKEAEARVVESDQPVALPPPSEPEVKKIAKKAAKAAARTAAQAVKTGWEKHKAAKAARKAQEERMAAAAHAAPQPQPQPQSPPPPPPPTGPTCPQCGIPVAAPDAFCFNCGTKIGKAEAEGARRVDLPVCRWATAGVWLGLLAFVLWALPGPDRGATALACLLPIGCGVVAVMRIRRRYWKLRGKGRAYFGIAIGVATLALLMSSPGGLRDLAGIDAPPAETHE